MHVQALITEATMQAFYGGILHQSTEFDERSRDAV